MATPDKKYFIDGIDLWIAFGMIVEGGSDDLLKFPERKDSISHDWQDANGIDIDLSRVFFKARDFSLRMSIIAASPADFWEKYNYFLAQMAQPGVRRLTIGEFDRSFYVYYRKCSAFTRFTKLKNEAGQKLIGCKFTVDFTEKEPTLNNLDTYIIDEAGRFIIT
jgi:hypothetical protein